MTFTLVQGGAGFEPGVCLSASVPRAELSAVWKGSLSLLPEVEAVGSMWLWSF